MPIPLITNDPLGVVPDNKPMDFKLLRAITHQLHEKGLVVVVASPIVMRELHHIAANRAAATANARDHAVAAMPGMRGIRATKRLAYAKLLRRNLFASQAANPNIHNICNRTLSNEFFQDVITGTDMNLYLGLHYSRKPGAGFEHRLAAISAWKPLTFMKSSPEDYANLRCLPVGTPEPAPHPHILMLAYDSFHMLAGPGHENQMLAQAYQNGEIAMLDLVCACHQGTNRPNNVNVEGAGRDMTLYALAKIARAKRAGARRYAAVLAYLSFVPGSNPRVYPLQRIMVDYGFRRVNVTYARTDALRGGNTQQAVEHYYVLCDTYTPAGAVHETWVDQLAHRVPDPSPLCALDTSTSRPLCV